MTTPFKQYAAVVADPPWPITWRKGRTTAGASSGSTRSYEKRALPYSTLTIEELCALPVEPMLADDAHLFLWTLDRFVLDGTAQQVMRAWGFEPLPRMIVWEKANAGLGREIRAAHELILLGRRGKARFLTPSVPSVQHWKQTYVNGSKVHSAKPEASLDLVEQLATGPYVELFARRDRLGWDTWGDESFGTATMKGAADPEQRDPQRVRDLPCTGRTHRRRAA